MSEYNFNCAYAAFICCQRRPPNIIHMLTKLIDSSAVASLVTEASPPSMDHKDSLIGYLNYSLNILMNKAVKDPF